MYNTEKVFTGQRNRLSFTVLFCAVCLALNGCIRKADEKPEPPPVPSPSESSAPEESTAKKELVAVFHTSLGKISCELYPEEAPLTVESFVSLAKGEKEWTDPKTGKKTTRPLYSGTIFHRVIPAFMIQGGDPLGTGFGGPGYQFEDEFSENLKFDSPGILAMANSGPGTNGSQFFITVAPTPWLNNRHTIFGKVIDGQDVANTISTVERDRQDRPLTPVMLERVEIIEKE